MAGIGVIIRDWHGEAIATLSLPIPLSHNVNELEALACRRGVQFAGEIGFRKVIFEGDSSVVINALSQGSGGFASYGNTLRISSSLLLISSFFFFFCHVKRICNVVANALAKNTKDLLGIRIWLEDLPKDISPLVLLGVH